MNRNLKQLVLLAACALALIALCIFGKYCENLKADEDSLQESQTEDTDISFFNDTWFDVTDDLPDTAEHIDLDTLNSDLYISMPGDYVLSGKLLGSVVIDAQDSNVRLILDGATIKSSKGAAISCLQADKLVITTVSGKENTISDTASYDDNDEADAAIFSNVSITVNGSGSIGIDGLYKDAIHSKGAVKILSSDISTKSMRYGINGNDGVAIKGGQLNISSKKDAIRTSDHGAAGMGGILIEGGDISIITGRTGLKTEKGNLYASKGNVFISSVLGAYDIGGSTFIEEGCINE